MKLTAEKLKKLIKEEMENLSEMMPELEDDQGGEDPIIMELLTSLIRAQGKGPTGKINKMIEDLVKEMQNYNSGEK